MVQVHLAGPQGRKLVDLMGMGILACWIVATWGFMASLGVSFALIGLKRSRRVAS